MAALNLLGAIEYAAVIVWMLILHVKNLIGAFKDTPQDKELTPERIREIRELLKDVDY